MNDRKRTTVFFESHDAAPIMYTSKDMQEAEAISQVQAGQGWYNRLFKAKHFQEVLPSVPPIEDIEAPESKQDKPKPWYSCFICNK